MNNFLKKIPVVRSIIRNFNKNQFDKKWRQLNLHNDTVAGERTFPIDAVSVGKSTYGMLNIQCFNLKPEKQLIIGNYVSIAPGVLFLLDVNHQTQTLTTFPLHTRLISPSPVDALSKGQLIIEDEVWIGTNALLFSGIRIGKGAIIAAGSIVTKDVPPYAIFGGNPGKIIRYKFSDEIIKILLPINLIDLPTDWMRENIETLYKKIETVDDALHLKNLTDTLKSEK